jgi:hypothetical protein
MKKLLRSALSEGSNRVNNINVTNNKLLYLQCLHDEQSCMEGMTLNSWIAPAICNKYLNIDIFISNLPSHQRSKVLLISIIVSISVCKYKFIGVRLRELLRSIKSWNGIQLYAPKVLLKRYPAPDNNLWLCRNFLNLNIC